MSNPQQNNETYANMNPTQQNLNLNPQNNNKVFYPIQSPVYTPVQPVPVIAGQGPIYQPVQYQVQGQTNIGESQQTNNTPQVIVIEERRKPKNSGRSCYCRGPRQSPCGCLDPNEEYCCAIGGFSYIIMSLSYILTCLCIWSLCRIGFRGGWC